MKIYAFCLCAALLISGCGAATAQVVDSTYLPRHAGANEGPSVRIEGPIRLSEGCFYLNGYLAIWPSEFSLKKAEGEVAIHGGGFVIQDGSTIAVSGGTYDDALPEAASSARDVPCPGPYLWVSEVISLE